MKVSVHLVSQSRPIVYDNVENAYTKDGMYCILLKDQSVHKYPLISIFRSIESCNRIPEFFTPIEMQTETSSK